MIIDRRQSLKLAGAATLGGTALAGMAAQPSMAAVPSEFDPNSPQDNLNGFVKIMGDLSGKPTWSIAQGTIYGLVEGEMPIPLVGVRGLRYIRFNQVSDTEYRMFVRDWGYYTDYPSGDMIEEFKNPYTGQSNKPYTLLTPIYEWGMTTNGQVMDDFNGEAWLIDRPLKMPWSFVGGQTAFTLELLVKYPEGRGSGAEWVNMRTDTDSFMDASLTSAPMSLSWTGYSPWIRWMEMGDRPGRTLWNSNGVKASSLDILDDDVRANYENVYPGSLDNPETHERNSAASTGGGFEEQ